MGDSNTVVSAYTCIYIGTYNSIALTHQFNDQHIRGTLSCASTMYHLGTCNSTYTLPWTVYDTSVHYFTTETSKLKIEASSLTPAKGSKECSFGLKGCDPWIFWWMLIGLDGELSVKNTINDMYYA